MEENKKLKQAGSQYETEIKTKDKKIKELELNPKIKEEPKEEQKVVVSQSFDKQLASESKPAEEIKAAPNVVKEETKKDEIKKEEVKLVSQEEKARRSLEYSVTIFIL